MTINIRFDENHAFVNRIKYVIKFLNDHPYLDDKSKVVENSKNAEDSVLIHYGLSSLSDQSVSTNYFIPEQGVIFSKSNIQNDDLHINEYQFDQWSLYSVESSAQSGKTFVREDRFSFDWIETIFFHISRYEEWVYDGPLNYKGMMPEDKMKIVDQGIEQTPVVDDIVFALFELWGCRKERKRINHLSFDVDHLRKYKGGGSLIKKTLGHLKRGEWSFIKSLGSRLKETKDPFDTFDWMLKEVKGRKEIYFLVGGNTKYDSPIDTEDEIFKHALQLCRERNYKVGIHPSYDASKDKALFQMEKENLEKLIGDKIEISRQHYLKWFWPKTLTILEENRISEDSSMGFSERIGYRCGTSAKYFLYNLHKEQMSDVLEKPLVIMDSALFKFTDSIGFEKRIKELREKSIGMNDINYCFHNNRFEESEIKGKGLKALLKKL